jgi:ribosomal protein L32
MKQLKLIGDIAKAYSKLLAKKLNISSEESNILSKKRLAVCDECPFYLILHKTCSECGCYMPAKTLLKDAECPKKYW